MNWFRENPFWSAFIAIAGGALLLAAGLLWWTKGSYDDAMAKYRESAAEQTRLESGNPYPSAANVGKMKTYLENYKAALDKLKGELKTRMLTEAPLAPNEFQTRLRQAILRTAENARNNRVKLRSSKRGLMRSRHFIESRIRGQGQRLARLLPQAHELRRRLRPARN